VTGQVVNPEKIWLYDLTNDLLVFLQVSRKFDLKSVEFS